MTAQKSTCFSSARWSEPSEEEPYPGQVNRLRDRRRMVRVWRRVEEGLLDLRVDVRPSIRPVARSRNANLGQQRGAVRGQQVGRRVPVLEQLGSPRYAAVLLARSRARDLLDASPPDYANAAKEAVSAVEQLALLHRKVLAQEGITASEVPA